MKKAPRKRALRWQGPAMVAPAMLALGLFYGAPVLYSFWLSLRNISLFEAGGSGGEFAGFKNFASVLTDPSTWDVLWNSAFWFTGITVVARIILGLGLAMLVNMAVVQRSWMRGLARSMVILPWAVPPVVAVVLWRFLLDPRAGAFNDIVKALGLSDTGLAIFQQVSTVWIGIDTIVIWRELPFVVLAFLAGLQTVPEELLQAAAVDGATAWQRFRHIILPLLRPVTTVVALLTTVWTFNNFVYVWLSTQGGPGTYTDVIGTAVYREAFVRYDVGRASALAMVAIVIMAVFAALYFFLNSRKDGEL